MSKKPTPDVGDIWEFCVPELRDCRDNAIGHYLVTEVIKVVANNKDEPIRFQFNAIELDTGIKDMIIVYRDDHEYWRKVA